VIRIELMTSTMSMQGSD